MHNQRPAVTIASGRHSSPSMMMAPLSLDNATTGPPPSRSSSATTTTVSTQASNGGDDSGSPQMVNIMSDNKGHYHPLSSSMHQLHHTASQPLPLANVNNAPAGLINSIATAVMNAPVADGVSSSSLNNGQNHEQQHNSGRPIPTRINTIGNHISIDPFQLNGHHALGASLSRYYSSSDLTNLSNAVDMLPPPTPPPAHMEILQLKSLAGTLPIPNYSFYHSYVYGPRPELLPPPVFQYRLPSMIYAPEVLNEFAQTLVRTVSVESVAGMEWRNHALANAHEKYNQADFPGALVLLQEIHILYPTHIPTLLLMGCCCYSMNRLDMAITYNQHILALDSNFAEAHSNMGTIYRSLGQFEQSEQCYRRALQLKPLYWDAICNLTSLFGVMGRLTDAIHVYENVQRSDQAVHHLLRPEQRRDIHHALGNLYMMINEPHRAQAEFQLALKAMEVSIGQTIIDPAMPQADREIASSILQSLAKIYQDQSRIHQVICCYYSALSLVPRNPNAINNLGILLSSLNLPERTNEAIQWYSFGLAIDPTHVHIYTNLGSAFKERGRVVDAINCYLTAIQIQPDFYIALANLGNTYKDIGNHDGAIECYQRALSFKPDFNDALANLVHSLNFICNWEDRPHYFAWIRDLLDVQLKSSTLLIPSVLPFHTFTYPLSITQVREISVRNAQKISQIVKNAGWSLAGHYKEPRLHANSRVRIGYVSSDFGDHPLSHLMQSVFGMHNRSRFEVFCYALSPNDGSSYRAKIERETEHFIDVSSWSIPKIIDRIVIDQIHVLVNLNGYTKGAKNEIFAARPCSVQVSYMGFAGTLGADWMDYLVVDEVVCPEAIVEREGGLFTERLIYMPHSYFVNDYKQGFREGVVEETIATTTIPSTADTTGGGPVRRLSFEDILHKRTLLRRSIFPNISPHAIIFANFNQLYKIDPKIFKSWLSILARVPHSIIWLLKFPSSGERHLRKSAEEYRMSCCPTVSSEALQQRIVFTDVAAKQEHIDRGLAVDLFLDTPECNAHTTAADILWAGTPLVTFPKIKMASRVAAGMAFTAGLGRQMVVTSYQEYEDRAVELALNPTMLLEMRHFLTATRESGRLFDTKRWTHNFERCLLEAWNQRASKLHAPIRISDPDDEACFKDLEDMLVVGKGRVKMSIPKYLDAEIKAMTE